MRRPKDDEDQYNHFQVVVQPKPNLAEQKVSCVYCQSQMKFLSGMPEGHGQWLCEACGSQAFEGYGDTPAHDSDYKTLAITNDPYPTIEGSLARPLLKDIAMDDELDIEDKEKVQDPRRHVKIDARTGNRRIRYGMRYAFTSAEEATRQI